ncbi:MAG: cysteine--tRNA ligase [Candidatus Saccharibacteria bacterium]
MKLYNTLTRQIDEIIPLQPPLITIYTCGPTVYDYAHIGHWFNYVRMDTLIRVLKASGLQTTWVMNITDVGHLVSDADDGEDKLEKGAQREGKTAWEVAQYYTNDFLDGMRQLHMLAPDHLVKATDHIAEQIELIKILETKGFTYIIDDGVYYDTSKFTGYSAFAGLDLDEQQASGRVQQNPQKHNPSDFAVWKFSPADRVRDMEWDSPWGKGFPGWHIECSAMSMKYLGDTLDIHTGGIDHIPVHHTNEIAQSEAATGKRFANSWFHSNHVTVNGEKISKSLGNGIRLQDITDKGITTDAIRLHVHESHYRSQAKFSWDSLMAAQNRLHHWQSVGSLLWQTQPLENSDSMSSLIETAQQAINHQLQNDINTPRALKLIDELFSEIEIQLLTDQSAAVFSEFLNYLRSVLGIDVQTDPLNNELTKLIIERQAARARSDWPMSDTLRGELAKQGVGIRDLPSGPIWYRL